VGSELDWLPTKEGEETGLTMVGKCVKLRECVRQKVGLMKEWYQVPWMRKRKRGLGKLP
jgi:hypothetical protein